MTLSSEQVIERWMLRIIADGGIDRFDDLHTDQIDKQWEHRDVWVRAGLEAFQIAVRLRNRYELPFIVALCFSLKTNPESRSTDFDTLAELIERLDWSPPSLYLFHPDRAPRGRGQSTPGNSAAVEHLNPRTFGTDVNAKRAYYLEFEQTDSKETVRTVMLEG